MLCYAVLHYNMPFYIRSSFKGLSSEEHLFGANVFVKVFNA